MRAVETSSLSTCFYEHVLDALTRVTRVEGAKRFEVALV